MRRIGFSLQQTPLRKKGFFALTPLFPENKAPRDVVVMHPGPINRGVEITSEVADGPFNVILEQVTNGVAIRTAILFLLLGGKGEK